MNHDLNIAALAVISACVLIWGLVSSRLERWDVSAPMALVVLGLAVTHGPTTLIHVNLHSSIIRSLAEVTLALVLFSDASRVNVRALRADAALPARLLGIGLPLTIGAGAGAAPLLFGGSGLWVAAAIGAIVAPTDAALGATIMGDERVPSGVRRLLNVESGLNDGIATPFVNLFLAGAVSAEAVHGVRPAAAAFELLGGAGLGIGVGVLRCPPPDHVPPPRPGAPPAFLPLAVLALALFAYSASVVAGTNGFIAAFVAGMAFGAVDRRDDEADLRFTEEAGTLLSLLVWFIFGAAMLGPGPGRRRAGAMSCSRSSPSPSCGWCPSPSLSPAAASTGPRWPSSAGSALGAWRRSCSASLRSTPWRRRSPRCSWAPSP